MKPFVPFFRLLVRTGRVVVIDADGERHVFGAGSANTAASDTVTMRLHDRRLHWRLVTQPTLAFGEAFMDGTLTLEEGTTLYRLLLVLMHNQSITGRSGFLGVID